ncbi:hypothetical protein EXM98_04000 [Clostridium botulinum]|uniref:hypothetical protein n=1 Tax=Clostridium botulinum TaxID=1491 RepID=UPI0005F97416|nr:hypothetical protein [Clostridium botulinum]MBY6800111.1 hypothetical protein [Clostridium botulinum]NFC27820.1 hypothetical protein [Clostridium botulinum]NFC60400.1 hypothetical protein [Clostridium botulinum]NFC68408.1 hypothetical protein [Clostridium botulinum]NFE37315.1 hypothetical protein [Clostridium botulinum]
MYLGERIIFNKKTGTVLNYCLDERFDSGLTEEMIDNLRPKEMDFIDLEYGSKVLKNAIIYHVDVETKEIIIDKYIEHIETEEEKLKREKQELENQLLLQADNNLDGGIL